MIRLIFFPVFYSFAIDGSRILKETGEKHYQIIKTKSSVLHGTCWHNALTTMKKDSGHTTYDCHFSNSDMQRRDCINNMSDRAFNAYNEFYIHTTHMCFYLNYEVWQAQTDNTIKQLHQVSTRMKDQLLEASEVQEVMLESQKESLKMQNKLLDHGKELGVVLKSSSESVNNMVKDFKETAKDQKELLFEIFSYLRTFQNWIIGEVSWFQSIMYYTISCILCALFSSSKRTTNARITLFIILSVNVIMERMLVQYYGNTMFHSEDNKESLVSTTWMYRKIALGLCIITLFCTYHRYRDEQIENYKALKRIEHQLNTIQEVTTICNTNHSIRYSARLALKRVQSQQNKQSKMENSL
ncbi:uncharacterized protein LOC116426567 isoform X2 [Nomia melanderi]|uniref:uncharacterized protein LOC116426567 isoform X2 n=2 Tax=Nomia melanderi TaxID=2448451 RepID=UPI001303F9CC|nr:uncharacterized protein LOC116426567 isoform X2 [Nomia melanderi]